MRDGANRSMNLGIPPKRSIPPFSLLDAREDTELGKAGSARTENHFGEVDKAQN
jgi:hypothetical protein